MPRPAPHFLLSQQVGPDSHSPAPEPPFLPRHRLNQQRMEARCVFVLKSIGDQHLRAVSILPRPPVWRSAFFRRGGHYHPTDGEAQEITETIKGALLRCHFTLCVYDLLVYNFHYTGSDIVHLTAPCHLIGGFHRFGDFLRLAICWMIMSAPPEER